ncbi:EMP47 Protein EMP47 [Candida maltosa Xu316]
MIKYYLFCFLFQLATAVIPNLAQVSSDASANPHFSLPNLLTIESLENINNWDISKNVLFDNGRLLLSDQSSIWGKYKVPTNNKPWTTELIFRSTGLRADKPFDNTLNVWLLNDDTTPDDKFDGFKIEVSNKEQPGLKVFNNDGSQVLSDKLAQALGACKFQYLESDVPFTLRVSYDEDKWFKIQMDNNLCFKTDQVRIPFENLKLGVTANVNQKSSEKFEVLAWRTWDKLTEDAIDDHGLMVGDEIKIDVKNEFKPRVGRESLMERAQRVKQQILKDQQQQQHQQLQQSNSDPFDIVLSKLDTLELTINGLSTAGEDVEMLNVDNKIQELHNAYASLKTSVDDTKQSVRELQSILVKQYAQMLESIAQLNQKVIGEVREQHFGMEEVSKKVDLLMNNHKEIAHQYQQNQIKEPSGSGNTVDTVMKWVLFPLMVILLALVIFVYRLRHDIKHSKLL